PSTDRETSNLSRRGVVLATRGTPVKKHQNKRLFHLTSSSIQSSVHPSINGSPEISPAAKTRFLPLGDQEAYW
ncbi:MAG: hypothetical protein ABIM88_05935, partial [candidate division WOR-3 bacterium]